MANSNATQIQINLQDNLNLNTNKSEISNFAGFNRRNSPFFNGGLSPLFKQEKAGSVIDKKGNVYKCENGNFYKNDVVIASGIQQQRFIKEKLEIPKNSDIKWAIDGDNNLFTISNIRNENHSGLVADIHYKTFSFEGVGVYKNIQCGYINKWSAGGILSNYEPVFYNGSGILYCLTWDTQSKGTLYYFNENTTTADLQTLKYSYSHNNAAAVSGAILSMVEEYKQGSVGPIYKGTQIRMQYIVSEQPTAVNGDFIVFRSNSGTLPRTEDYSVFVEKTPFFVIKKDSGDLFNTDYSRTTSNGLATLYNISFSESPLTATYSQLTTSTFICEGDYIQNSCKAIYDGEVVYVNGILKKNNVEYSLSMRNGKHFYGEGCINDDNDYTFSKNLISLGSSSFQILYNNNKISGISCNGTLLTPFLDIDGFVERTWANVEVPTDIQEYEIGQYRLGYIYKSASDKNFYKLNITYSTKLGLSYLNERYILIDTTDFYNAYDVKTDTFTHLFYDYNNRAFFYALSNFDTRTVQNPVSIASGIDVNYEILMKENISSIFNPLVLSHCIPDNIDTDTPLVFKETFSGNISRTSIDIYYSKDAALTPKYNASFDYSELDKFKKNELYDVTYPVSTDGNIILSPSLFATFYDSQIGADYIKDGRYYNLIYYEGMPILAYYYGSGVANSEARFVIQGQSFVIRNGLIYSTYYNNGLMYVNDPIVNVDDLQFIGALPLAAFFYSPATKCVLMFTGDRNLSTAFEATELKSVNSYKYAPNDNSLYLATDDAVYVLFNTPDGNSFVYKIEEENIIDFVPQDNGCIAMKGGDTWNIFSFFEREDFNNVPVRLSTKFYGAGLNRVSVVDCWYIRLFTETPKAGKVKVKVETLTNKACTSEEQTFEISKEKWEESNNIVYIRYQPKLQRGVGVSLTVESDFTVYDIQASVKPDSTIQLTPESSVQVSAEKGI